MRDTSIGAFGRLLIVLFLALVVASQATAQRYTIEDLAPADLAFQGEDLNGQGLVPGSAIRQPTGPGDNPLKLTHLSHGVAGQLERLSPFNGRGSGSYSANFVRIDENGTVYGVQPDGQVVALQSGGQFFTLPQPPAALRYPTLGSYLETRFNPLSRLVLPIGGASSTVLAVNTEGGLYRYANGSYGLLAGGSAFARDMNENGMIVGSDGNEAKVWSGAQSVTIPRPIQDWRQASNQAIAISSGNAVVGYQVIGPVNPQDTDHYVGWLASADGSALVQISGMSLPVGVNDRRQVVGFDYSETFDTNWPNSRRPTISEGLLYENGSLRTFSQLLGSNAAGWSNLRPYPGGINEKGEILVMGTHNGRDTAALMRPVAPGYAIDVWWVTQGANIGGTQPFKALIYALNLSQYQLYWQVDDGQWNWMYDSYADYPHKEAMVDVSGWRWREPAYPGGPRRYKINFIATGPDGQVIGRSAGIWVNVWN